MKKILFRLMVFISIIGLSVSCSNDEATTGSDEQKQLESGAAYYLDYDTYKAIPIAPKTAIASDHFMAHLYTEEIFNNPINVGNGYAASADVSIVTKSASGSGEDEDEDKYDWRQHYPAYIWSPPFKYIEPLDLLPGYDISTIDYTLEFLTNGECCALYANYWDDLMLEECGDPIINYILVVKLNRSPMYKPGIYWNIFFTDFTIDKKIWPKFLGFTDKSKKMILEQLKQNGHLSEVTPEFEDFFLNEFAYIWLGGENVKYLDSIGPDGGLFYYVFTQEQFDRHKQTAKVKPFAIMYDIETSRYEIVE